MPLAVTQHSLDVANWMLIVAGIALWAVVLFRWRGRPRDPLAPAPNRPSRMKPEAIPVCMLVYLTGASLAKELADRFASAGLAPPVKELMDRVVPVAIGGLLGAAACVHYGKTAFPSGLRDYGLSWRRPGRETAIGAAGLLLALPVCAGLLLACEHVLRWWRPIEKLPTHPALDALRTPGVPAWVRLFAIVGPVVIAPVAEELFFRGIVQTYLKEMLGSRWRAVLLAALFFGAAHYLQPQVVIPLASLAIVLGFLYERRGSLIAPITLHVLFNLRTIVWQVLLTVQ